MKEPKEFHRNRATPSGRQYYCKICRSVANAAKFKAVKSSPERFARYRKISRETRRKWRLANPRNARILGLMNKHGYSRADAEYLATQLTNPYQRCTVCGIPGRWLEAKRRDGWKRGPFQCGLTVDHRRSGGPSTLKNTRICCLYCNLMKGAEERTDEEVLFLTRRWYELRGFLAKELWWLHTSPGHGGLDRLGTERVHSYDTGESAGR